MINTKLKNLILSLVLLLCIFFSGVQGFSLALANEVYSNVMDDLRKDSSFNAGDYLPKAKDYSLQVITVAESTDKQLLVYVYQPSALTKTLDASSINISVGVKLNVHNYTLSLLSRDGLFAKYVVNDLTVPDDEKRIYDVVSIYRLFDDNIDDKPTGDNEIDEMVYTVSKRYYFYTNEVTGLPVNSCFDLETVVINPEDKFVGFVRYKGGFQYSVTACDSHFVAFSTKRKIEKLKSVKVGFSYQSYSAVWSPGSYTQNYGDIVTDEVTLTETQKGSYTGSGWFAPTYNWGRIEKVEYFLANPGDGIYNNVFFGVTSGTKLTDSAKEILKEKEWILRFYETDYSFSAFTSSTIETTTLVSNVTIIQLEFETDGITYNLGVVDNKQTGSGEPINTTEWSFHLNEGGWILLFLIILIILCIIFGPSIMLGIFKAIVWLLLLPFKIPKWIYEAIRERRERK